MALKISQLTPAASVAGTEPMELGIAGDKSATVAQISSLSTPGFKNFLINGDFAINQRGFAGGALAAGVYGFDRWKAGTGGCNVSLSGVTLSHTSGPLVQVIEAPGLASRNIMVSVEDLTGGNLTVNVEGVTGIIVAGAGRKGVALAVPSGSTGNITVTLTPVSSAVSYKRVQIEQGSAATAFEWRFAGLELSLCQRYFQKLSTTSGTAFVMATAYTATNALGFLYLPVSMRAAPTIAVTGTIGMTPGTGSGTAGITVVSNQIMAIIVSQTSVTVGNSGYFSATAGGQSISLSSEL